MRAFFLILLLLTISMTASAAVAPPGQVPIGPDQVLRGRFTQESQMKGSNIPIQSSGHFVLAPAHGLIWNMEKPFPTSTIITPKGSVQDFGGVAVKLSIKNLRHLYEMIGGALRGDWSGLEADYIITPTVNTAHWQMLLTPRPDGKSKTPYASITVDGSRFVEKIAMTKIDGGVDTLDFTEEVLSPAPLTANENLAFNEVGR
jgi:hypothetical protein